MLDAKLDEIFEKVDAHFRAGEFSEVDTLITELDVSELCETLIVGWLVASGWGRDRLPSRPGFVDRCEERLEVLCPGRVERLLRNLR